VRVADVLPDEVRVLDTELVDKDDTEAERLLVGLRVDVVVALAVLDPLDELVADFDAEDVREDEGDAVVVVDAVDVFESEGELVVVRDADELRVVRESQLVFVNLTWISFLMTSLLMFLMH
jgi:Ni,Fe-hydrogenase maturation factor